MTPNTEITAVDIAFPARVSHLIPETIPKDYPHKHEWHRFQSDWFFSGLPKDTKFLLNEGIDGQQALNHLKCIQGSFEPKHEVKEAAVAYLSSLWFKNVFYGGKWLVEPGPETEDKDDAKASV